MAYGCEKFRFHLLALLVCLCYLPVFGDEAKEQSTVFNISFGVIEPPVVAQQDITIRVPTSNQQTEAKALECSGLAWLDGYLIIASDRHEHLLFTCPVNLDTMEIGTPQSNIIILNEQNLFNDAESLTLLKKEGRTSLYLMSSLSNAPNAQSLPQRRLLLQGNIKTLSPFKVDPVNVQSVETLRQQLETCFTSIKVRPYYAFDAENPGQDKNTYRWANVEGISFTSDGRYLLGGMRNPLFDHAAMLFVVSGIGGPAQPVQPDALKVTDFFLLDLEDRGISDLSWDPLTSGYLITAAKSNGPHLDPDSPYPPNTLDSALFWWSGNKTDKPVLVARIPDMTIEAVCRLGSSRYIVLGSDEGDISESRGARQSILTVVEFTGIPR